MATLQGQSAIDYIKKNKVGSTSVNSGFLGNLFNSLGSTFTRPLIDLNEFQNYNKSQDKENYQSQYLNQDDFNKTKDHQGVRALKDVAGLASFAVPMGGAGLLGNVVRAGLAGGLNGFGTSESGNELGDTLKGAGFGAATGGVLGLAGKGLSKLGSKGASAEVPEGAAGLNKIVDDIAAGKKPSYLNRVENRQIEAKAARNVGDYTKLGDSENIVGGGLKAYGIKTPNKIKALDQLGENVKTDLTKAYQTHTNDIGNIFDSNALTSNVDSKRLEELSSGIKLNGGNQSVEDLQNYLRDKVNHYGTPETNLEGSMAGNAKLSANDLWSLVKDTSAPAAKLAKGGELKPDEELTLMLHNAAKDMLSNEPTLNDVRGLNKTFHAITDVYSKTAANRKAGESVAIPMLSTGVGQRAGIKIPIGNTASDLKVKAIQALQGGANIGGAAGSTLGKTGNGLSKLSAMPILGAAASNIVQSQPTNQERNDQFFNNSQSQNLQGSTMGVQAPTSPMGMQNGMNGQPSMQGGQMGMDINQLRDRRNQLARQIAMQIDSKGNLVYKPSEAIEQANAIMMSQGANPMALGGANSMKPLSGSDQKAYSQAQNGIDSLDQVAALLKGGNGALAQSSLLPGIFQSSNARQYQNAVSTAAMNLGYLQSGANVSPEERKRIESLFPSWHDDEATKQAKLASLYNQFAMAKPMGGMQMQQQQY